MKINSSDYEKDMKSKCIVKVQNTTCKPCFSNYAFVQFQQNFCTIGVLSVSVSCVLS